MEVKAILPSGNQADFFLYKRKTLSPLTITRVHAVLTYSGKNTVDTHFLGAGLD